MTFILCGGNHRKANYESQCKGLHSIVNDAIVPVSITLKRWEVRKRLLEKVIAKLISVVHGPVVKVEASQVKEGQLVGQRKWHVQRPRVEK